MLYFTYNQALEAQNKQLEYYSKSLTEEGRQKLEEMLKNDTKPCPEGVSPDELLPARELFHLVPRGGWFEQKEVVEIIKTNKRGILRDESLVETVLDQDAERRIKLFNERVTPFEKQRLNTHYYGIPATGVMKGCTRIVRVTEKATE